jgi:multicomponent Na+:H+ antiporter subunit E
MRMFIANLFLALVWALMSEGFTMGQLTQGFVFGYLLLLFLQPLIGGSRYLHKVRKLFT